MLYLENITNVLIYHITCNCWRGHLITRVVLYLSKYGISLNTVITNKHIFRAQMVRNKYSEGVY